MDTTQVRYGYVCGVDFAEHMAQENDEPEFTVRSNLSKKKMYVALARRSMSEHFHYTVQSIKSK